MNDFSKIGTMMIRRTIMIDELRLLFQYCPDLNATLEQYNAAVIEENCLGKVSMSACRTPKISDRAFEKRSDSDVKLFNTKRIFLHDKR